MTDYTQLVFNVVKSLVDDLNKIPGVKASIKVASIEIDVEGEIDDTPEDEDSGREGRLSK